MAPLQILEDHTRTGPGASKLEDGPAHHHRFRHHDEQRLRSHRSPMALRRGPRQNSRRDPSAVHYSLHGRICGWFSPGTAWPNRYALTYPERVPSNTHALDWSALKKLDFEEVPAKKFPCLTLAKEALREGGPLPCALNAADEIAVAAFLEKRLEFLEISEVIEKVLGKMPRTAMNSIEDVLQADGEARRLARIEVERRRN